MAVKVRSAPHFLEPSRWLFLLWTTGVPFLKLTSSWTFVLIWSTLRVVPPTSATSRLHIYSNVHFNAVITIAVVNDQRRRALLDILCHIQFSCTGFRSVGSTKEKHVLILIYFCRFGAAWIMLNYMKLLLDLLFLCSHCKTTTYLQPVYIRVVAYLQFLSYTVYDWLLSWKRLYDLVFL